MHIRYVNIWNANHPNGRFNSKYIEKQFKHDDNIYEFELLPPNSLRIVCSENSNSHLKILLWLHCDIGIHYIPSQPSCITTIPLCLPKPASSCERKFMQMIFTNCAIDQHPNVALRWFSFEYPMRRPAHTHFLWKLNCHNNWKILLIKQHAISLEIVMVSAVSIVMRCVCVVAPIWSSYIIPPTPYILLLIYTSFRILLPYLITFLFMC